jgi:hypothetical protein
MRHAAEMDQPLEDTVEELLPRLVEDLVRLAAIPSIAAEGFPPERVHEAHDLVVELLRGAGVTDIGTLDLPDTYPIITQRFPDLLVPRLCCSTPITTCNPQVMKRCGTHRPSSHSSETGSSTAGVWPTTSPI